MACCMFKTQRDSPHVKGSSDSLKQNLLVKRVSFEEETMSQQASIRKVPQTPRHPSQAKPLLPPDPDARDILYETATNFDEWAKVDPYSQGLIINYRTENIPHEAFMKRDVLKFNNDLAIQSDLQSQLVEELVYHFQEDESPAVMDSHSSGSDSETSGNGTAVKSTASSMKLTQSMRSHASLHGCFLENRTEAYTRLITLNYWHKLLVYSLMQGFVVVIDFVVNAIFCASIWGDGLIALDIRLLFTTQFILLESFQVYTCYRVARKRWKQGTNTHTSGDLIVGSWRDNTQAVITMTVLNLLLFPTIVKDIVIMLHPMKSVQEFAAFKCDGHRAFLLGWPSKEAFEVSFHRGREKMLPLSILSRSVLTFLKFYILLSTRGILPAAASLCGLGACIAQCILLQTVWKSRRDHYEYSIEMMAQNDISLDAPIPDRDHMDGLNKVQKALVNSFRRNYGGQMPPQDWKDKWPKELIKGLKLSIGITVAAFVIPHSISLFVGDDTHAQLNPSRVLLMV